MKFGVRGTEVYQQEINLPDTNNRTDNSHVLSSFF
jgi:hypothetical protein